MFRVTERAATEIKRLAQKRGKPDDWIQLGLAGGGCSGFKYLWSWIPPMQAFLNIHTLIEEHGVKIFIDAKSYIYLRETELDFETGIQGHGFKFKNPKVSGTCGCGESVQF
jgi:iron-sulfur cluster assembly protein